MSPSIEPSVELPGYLHEWDEAGNFVVELVVAERCRVELQQVVELRDHLYQSNICKSKKHMKRSFGCFNRLHCNIIYVSTQKDLRNPCNQVVKLPNTTVQLAVQILKCSPAACSYPSTPSHCSYAKHYSNVYFLLTEDIKVPSYVASDEQVSEQLTVHFYIFFEVELSQSLFQ